MALHNLLVTKMASVINDRCKASPEANVGGVIINTCGWTKGAGYAALGEFMFPYCVIHFRAVPKVLEDLKIYCV